MRVGSGLGLTVWRVQQPKFFRHGRKVEQRTSVQLLHHLLPVSLDRPLRDAECKGNLLVYLPSHHQGKNTPLAWREIFEPLPQGGDLVASEERGVVALKRTLNGREQVGFGDRLCQEIFCA